jgi:hypothetical protein
MLTAKSNNLLAQPIARAQAPGCLELGDFYFYFYFGGVFLERGSCPPGS